MANLTKFKGFKWDAVNSRLIVYIGSTAVAYIDNATPYLTSPVGLTVTTGNLTVTAGDSRITAGNLRLGAVTAFQTTEPTSAAVFKQGTAPVGTCANTSTIYSSATVMRKIPAAGTSSNIET